MGEHRKWRAHAKKMRRKRLRQKVAQERDKILQEEQERKENSPRYQAWLSEQRALELIAEEEEAHQAAQKHAAWLAEEARAQKAWQERQEKLALARAERAKQELRIKEEWEEEQKKLKIAKEEQERKAQEKQLKQEELMRHIEDVINRGGDMPSDVNVASATNPDRPLCPFFTKTGACRFGDRCSRNHARPGISRVLLVPNFYDHIGLRQMNPEELEAADDWLEYEDSETYQHFLEFFQDVLPEWERVGTVSQFKVCCNFEPHLKGNVYVEYDNVRDAVKAFKLFHGRWYGGKQINVEFVKLESWKAAICGQFHKHCCPKGRLCNFLHVFRNPGNAFRSADHDRQVWRRKQQRSPSRSPHSHSRSWSRSPETSSRNLKEWRWSASPSPPRVRSSADSSHSFSSSRSSYSSRRRNSHSSWRDGSVENDRNQRRKRPRELSTEDARERMHAKQKQRSYLKSQNSHQDKYGRSAGSDLKLSKLSKNDSVKKPPHLETTKILSKADILNNELSKRLSSEDSMVPLTMEGLQERKEVDPDAIQMKQSLKKLDRRKKKQKKKKEKKSSYTKDKRRKKKCKSDSPKSSCSDSRTTDSDS